jgi:pantoate kinase
MAVGRGPARASSARAFAPAHVTGFFAPDLRERDPRGRGSVGAGLVLSAGVTATATWRRAAATRIHVASREDRTLSISEDVAVRLVGARRGHLTVELVHDLPIGQGFGASAAGALATALAVTGALRDTRARPFEVAHLADLFGGGGLGGVAALGGGGLEVRERAGIPPWGHVRHRRFPWPVFIVVAGPPIASPPLLRDAAFLARVSEAGSAALRRFRTDPSPRRFLGESEAFTDVIALGDARLRRLLLQLRGTGASVAQAMFGRSLFAVPRSAGARRRLLQELERRRLPAVELATARRGGHRIARAAP